MYPPLILSIKGNNGDKPDKDCIKIKFRRDPMSQKLDLCELKTALFDNGDLKEFLLFIIIFNMTLDMSGIILAIVEIQYLCRLVHVEVLCNFFAFHAEVVSTTLENWIPLF